MNQSLEQLHIKFEELRQYLSDSLDYGIITGDQYDCAQYIISRAFPLETREVHINEGTLEENSDPSNTCRGVSSVVNPCCTSFLHVPFLDA